MSADDAPGLLDAAATPIAGGLLLRLSRAGQPLRVRELLEGWICQPAFADAYTKQLLDAADQLGAEAVFWEHPAWTQATLEVPAELALLAAPRLARATADASSFAAHLRRARGPIAVFPNLRGDSMLFAPVPSGDDAFAHLLAFLREAPRAQIAALWATVGAQVITALGDAPQWLSTSGLGVPWLHVRLDPRPKYIQHQPYRRR